MNTCHSKLSKFLTVIAVFFCVALPPAHAQPKPPTIAEAPKENVDAVLLLDASASMRLTDPERLRDEGATLFLQFLKEGDRLSIVEFDSEARVLRPLSNYHPVQDVDIEETVRSASDVGLYTDLVAGVIKAKQILEETERENTVRTIILLSDGKLDPDPARATVEGLRAGLVYGLLPELKQKEIVLHTLALSEEADRKLLAQMAQATDGMSWYSESPEEIHEAFAELFLVVKKPQIVPMTSKGFRIDGEVEQATFYINTEDRDEPFSLQSPSGNAYDPEATGPGMKWFQGQKFDTITIDDPEVGTWQILGLPTNKGFATVLTNLKLITDWPSSIIAGNKRVLRARLYDNERPVVLPEMTNITTYAFQITPTDRVSEPIIRSLLKDDGEGVDELADDGVFSSEVAIEQAGDYQLKLLAKGPTFERQQTIPFRAKPRLVNLSVVAVENESSVGVGKATGTTVDYFRVTLNPEVANLTNIVVQLLAKDKKRNLYELDIQKREDGSLRYEVAAAALAEEGEYELQATVTGETRRKKIRGMSQVIKYTRKHTELDAAVEVQRVGIKEEPEEEPDPPVVLWSILIFFMNIGTAAFCLKKMSTSASKQEESLPELHIPEEVVSGIAELEERAVLTEVDLEDPIYSDEGGIDVPLPGAAATDATAEEASDEGAAGEEKAGQDDADSADKEGEAGEDAIEEEGEEPKEEAAEGEDAAEEESEESEEEEPTE